MPTNRTVEKFQKREERGEDYAAKGRKLNKRNRQADRDNKRSMGDTEE